LVVFFTAHAQKDVTMTSHFVAHSVPRTTGSCRKNFVEIDQTVLELWPKVFHLPDLQKVVAKNGAVLT
ncbi:MAG TPA: hypothetical protein VIJ25_13110, partial [Methylococcales bacterium]